MFCLGFNRVVVHEHYNALTLQSFYKMMVQSNDYNSTFNHINFQDVDKLFVQYQSEYVI